MEILVFLFLMILLIIYLLRLKIKVLYIITITFLTTAFFGICHSLFMAFKDLDFSLDWLGYNFLFNSVITVLPIMVSVIIFKSLLKRYILFKNAPLRFSIQFLAIFFFIQCGFFCWALLDMQFYDLNYEYTLPNILNAYRSNYLDLLPASFLIPVAIIYLDNWYEKRWRHNKNVVITVEENGPENKS